MADDAHFPDCHDDLAELSPELRSLYRELLADGTAWRAEQPAMPRLNDTIATLMSQREASHHTDTTLSARATPTARPTGSRVWQTDTKGTLSMRPLLGKHLRGFAAVAAALAVAALLSVMLLNTALHRRPTPSLATTPTSVHGQWVEQSRLSEAGASSDPAIAPSDPSVVYETANTANTTNTANTPKGPGSGGGYTITLRTTSDGGATWHAINFPDSIHAADVKDALFFVSPLNAHTVFLQLFGGGVSNCPPGSSASEGDKICILVFVSTNSGASWSLPHLPVAGVLGYAGPVGGQPLYAQGTRLYSRVACYGDASCTRIVASDDGGLTWQPVDGAIRAGGQSICDYAASPSGSTIFAVTAGDQCAQQGQSAMLLWRSDDAGAQWHQVGALPQPFEHGMAVTPNPTGGTPLLYVDIPKQIGTVSKGGVSYVKLSASPSDLRVSDDGGQTWHATPTQGAPTNLEMDFGPYGVLSDGSVVFPFVPIPNVLNGPTEESLYTWKLGDTSWHLLAPAFPSTKSYIETLTITSSSGQGDTLWAVAGDHKVYVFHP